MALHPTIKPIALMERIILASTNPGDVVLDFFAGSGSTLVAAKMHKRDYVGCDMNADYVKIARNRLKDV
jgi:DNA modification methylase